MTFDFWDESLWLPQNVSWGDVENGPDKSIVYASIRDLWYLVPLVLLVLIQRYLFEKYIFKPIALYLNVKPNKRKNVPYIPVLEGYFKKSRKLTNIYTISKQLDMSERQIERWWRLRLNQDKPSNIVKFCENMWRGSFFILNTTYGIYTLWDKEWVWDVDKCFIGYPHQSITADIWWYYMISSAFYWSLTISQFWDVKRKDFWQMFMHHIATVTMFTFSWIVNFYRVGCLIIILHDCSDAFLEFGKAAKYAGFKRIVNANFVIFISLWWIMRMYICPVYVLVPLYRQPFKTPVIIMLTSAMTFLMVLNVIWSWMIVKVAVKVMTTGEIKDNRSSNSEED